MSAEAEAGVIRPSRGPWTVEWPDPDSGLAMVEGPIVMSPEGPVAEILSSNDADLRRCSGDAELIRSALEMRADLDTLQAIGLAEVTHLRSLLAQVYDCIGTAWDEGAGDHDFEMPGELVREIAEVVARP